MEESDFQEYLAKYGGDENAFSSDEEEQAEIEAELYSRIHYGEKAGEISKPAEDDINDHLSVDLLREIVKAKEDKVADRHVDSGVSSLKSEEDDCIEIIEDDEVETTSKATNNDIEVTELSSDSDEDEIVQVLHSSQSEKKKVPNLVDLIASSDSDSETEHFPCFRRQQEKAEEKKCIAKKEKLIVETETASQEMRPKQLNARMTYDKNNSLDEDSSCQEIESDDSDIQMSDLHLNLSGGSYKEEQRTFQQVIGNKPTNYDMKDREEQPQKWSKEMKSFYNDVNPELADITLDDIMNELPDDPNQWIVKKPHASTSRYNTPSRYFHGRKCTNCNRDGHNDKSCPEPKRRKLCYMCCEEGHNFYECPDQHCLRCGEPGQPYSENCRKCRYLDTMTCRLCGGRGHILSRCPDTWRRFHATTSADNGLIVPDVDVHVGPAKVWCCNCARQGHFVHQCRAYSYSCIPPLVLSVVSYKEPQQFQLQSTSPEESRKAKKRRLRDELKACKRAYLSLPATPKLETSNGSFLSQPTTPSMRDNQKNVSQVLNKAKATLENLVESKKQRRKNKKLEKKFSIKLQMESKESSPMNAGSYCGIMKEKLSRSKKDVTPEARLARRKLMKELHIMKRHSKASVGAKKRKKLDNLLSRI